MLNLMKTILVVLIVIGAIPKKLDKRNKFHCKLDCITKASWIVAVIMVAISWTLSI